MELEPFNEVIVIAIGINFAYILISKATNTNFYELLELSLKSSLDRIVKKSLKALIPCKLFEEKLNFIEDKTFADKISKALLNIQLDISNLVSLKKEKGQKLISLNYHSHISMFLGLYGILVLFVAPLKLDYLNNSLFVLNVFSSILFILIFFNEYLLHAWGFKHTIIGITIVFIAFILSQFSPYRLIIIPTSLYKENFYFTIILPYLGLVAYFLKAILGTEYIVARFSYKIKKYNIQSKIDAFNFLIEDASHTLPTVDQLDIKPHTKK
ncbi:MAG: hypothetical protein PHS84_01115 [Paludibacter sp.]|jgi:hypothetical protein|nr:hypothetical protein [Paludibacter sp.]